MKLVKRANTVRPLQHTLQKELEFYTWSKYVCCCVVDLALQPNQMAVTDRRYCMYKQLLCYARATFVIYY